MDHDNTPTPENVPVEDVSVDEGHDTPVNETTADQSVEPTVTSDFDGGSQDGGSGDVDAELKRWEQRYRSLAGVLRSKEQQIEQMQQLLASLQQSMQAQQAEANERRTAEAVEPDKLVSASDRSALGDEVVDFVTRVVGQAVRSAIGSLEQRLAALEAGLNETAQRSTTSAQSVFQQELGRLVPDWEQINVDPEFIAWLEASPARKRGFSEAASMFDASGVAVYFNAYKAERAPTTTQQVQKPKPKPKPNRAASAPQQKTSANKKVWTRQEILDFYARGRQVYSPEEFRRLEKDLFEAQREGRVEL